LEADPEVCGKLFEISNVNVDKSFGLFCREGHAGLMDGFGIRRQVISGLTGSHARIDTKEVVAEIVPGIARFERNIDFLHETQPRLRRKISDQV